MSKQATCPQGTTPYTIKSGDTFYHIAIAHGISLEALMAANPGVDPNRLQIGQVICIPTSSPGPGPTPPVNNCPTLSYGSRGTSVQQAQQLLRNAGFDPGPIDGIFGSKTQQAVIAFQKSKHLVPDGVIGVATWTALGVNCGHSTTCPPGTITYVIKPGDTFFNLAMRYHTTVDAIKRANPNVNPNNLQVGQTICIP